MNNAASSSSLPQPHHADGQRPLNNHDPLSEAEADGRGGETGQQRKRDITRRQKIVFLDHLIREFDIVIYCQLSILYYMDISLLKLLVRGPLHFIYLTPKPHPPSILPLSPLPPLPFIALATLVPFLLHTFTNPPSASETSRGYLHGGFVIDFVGQRAPAPKIALLALDLLVLGLQVVMTALVRQRRALDAQAAPGPASQPGRRQDHDAEERGVLLPPSPSPPAAVVVQRFSRGGNARADREPGAVLPSTRAHSSDADDDNDVAAAADANEPPHPLDTFRSGQYVISTVNVMDAMLWVGRRRRGPRQDSRGAGSAVGIFGAAGASAEG